MKNDIQLKKNQHFYVCKRNSQKQSSNRYQILSYCSNWLLEIKYFNDDTQKP